MGNDLVTKHFNQFILKPFSYVKIKRGSFLDNPNRKWLLISQYDKLNQITCDIWMIPFTATGWKENKDFIFLLWIIYKTTSMFCDAITSGYAIIDFAFSVFQPEYVEGTRQVLRSAAALQQLVIRLMMIMFIKKIYIICY